MAQFSIDINDEDLAQLDSFCEKTGFSKDVLVNIYIKKILNQNKVPFEIGVLPEKKKLNVSGFDFVNKVDPGVLINVLIKEEDLIIAIVLSSIDSGKAATLLELLDEETRLNVIQLIYKGVVISQKVVNAIAEYIYDKCQNVQIREGFGSVDTVVEILNLTKREVEKKVIEDLENTAPDTAEEIKKRLFVFEDIVMLDDRAIQKILREIDMQELAKSLKNADEEVKGKIFRNMSKRAGEMLQEDMEFMGPVRLKDVHEAQEKIVAIIRRLEDYGDIVIASRDDIILS